MTALAAELTHINADALARDYTLRCPDAIVDFVNAHPFLLPLLLEAPAHVQCCFGTETRLALEIFYDEESHSSPELFVLIQTSEEAEQAMQQQACLRQEWWRDASRQAQQQLNISLEFV